MKNYIIIILSTIYSVFCFPQGNTKVTINIPPTDSVALKAEIFVLDPTQAIGLGKYRDTLDIVDGQCQFSFDISNPSLMTLIVNNKFVTFPGEYMVVIQPADDLIFDLPPITEAENFGIGISKIKIRGHGSEKINLTKAMVKTYLDIYRTDPPFDQQSLSYRFETADRKLTAIDLLYNSDTIVPANIKDIIKAKLYASVLTSVIRVSKRSKSDSVRLLFDKYIVDKKRINVFYKKDIVKYGGMIGSYLILSEFTNPVTVGGDDYQTRNRMKYAELLVRRLKDFPEIRDHLLSSHLITTIRSGFDSTTTKLYEYYCKESDFNNPNYTAVTTLYDNTANKLAEGKRFYNFALPDSTGKIYRLADFKGSVLVIDFWYNGCGGCKLMVPVLEEIEKEMADKNVQFLSIGIDRKDLWLKGIGKYSSANSLQLFTDGESKDHPMMKYLNIYAYPRLFVVDKNGNVTSAPPEPRSNKENFKKFLNTLL